MEEIRQMVIQSLVRSIKGIVVTGFVVPMQVSHSNWFLCCYAGVSLPSGEKVGPRNDTLLNSVLDCCDDWLDLVHLGT